MFGDIVYIVEGRLDGGRLVKYYGNIEYYVVAAFKILPITSVVMWCFTFKFFDGCYLKALSLF